MVAFPPAKINLGLDITGRLPNGYHSIRTVFYPIPLTDVLEVVPHDDGGSDGLSVCNKFHGAHFHFYGIPVDCPPEQNILARAHALLCADFPEMAQHPVDIHLSKQIPFGAGLGGGSADASYLLKMLDAHYALGLSAERLFAYARSLGADCPFFLQDAPLYAEGIGCDFSPVEVSLSGYALTVIKPPFAVPTAEAYRGVTPATPRVSLREVLQSTPIASWRDVVKNDFEASLFPRYPLLAALKDALYRHGALYASLSGSGSALYGIFPAHHVPEALAAEFPDCFVWHGSFS